jgi:hypothetical protein
MLSGFLLLRNILNINVFFREAFWAEHYLCSTTKEVTHPTWLFLQLDFGHLPRNQLAGKWQPHEGFIAAA